MIEYEETSFKKIKRGQTFYYGNNEWRKSVKNFAISREDGYRTFAGMVRRFNPNTKVYIKPNINK